MKVQAPTRLMRAEFKRNVYFEMIAPGIPLSDVMDGDFWVHVRKQLRANDVIEAVAADGSFDAELRILSVNQISGAMAFRVLRNVKGAAVAVQTGGAEERFVSKHVKFGKYQILDRKTGEVAVDGLDKAGAETEKARLEAERQAA